MCNRETAATARAIGRKRRTIGFVMSVNNSKWIEKRKRPARTSIEIDFRTSSNVLPVHEWYAVDAVK